MTTRLLVIMLAFFTVTAVLAETGFIKDPDGYTNIREGKSTASRIVGRMLDKDVLEYFPEKKEKWIPVHRKKIFGFVHASRVVPFSSLDEDERRRIILKIFTDELTLAKLDSYSDHHEDFFDVILQDAAKLIGPNKDEELLRLLIEIVKNELGSADEGPSGVFRQIFSTQPEWTAEIFEKNKAGKDLVAFLEDEEPVSKEGKSTLSTADRVFEELKKKYPLKR
ncbi:MAG: SH3 domain-containing protein [Pseudomonadota bacterium]